MNKTLLNVVQQVSGELSQSVPSAVLSDSTGQTQQLKYLTIAACDELADLHDWQRLIKTYVLTTVAGQASYPLPTDLLRILPETFYDRTNTRELSGNLTPTAWSNLGTSFPGVWSRFRIVGNSIVLTPTPGSTASSISFDYISRNYVIDVGLGTLKPEFTLDSDLTIYHDRLLINFVKLKFLQEQGMNTQSATENFNVTLHAAMAADTPAPRISLIGGSGRMHYLNEDNLPDGNWGI